MESVEDTIKAITMRIAAEFNPLRIVLFGSHARGDATKGSDVDFLVVMPAVDDKRRTAVEIRRRLNDFDIPKDIVVAAQEEVLRRGAIVGTLLRSALAEGKVVYDRG